jgi:O-antigen/teichoic acid export membrane protein
MALGKILIGRLKQLQFLRSASAKNVMVVMSGTIVAQALPILFFPILSRIYTPSDYGILGLFMSISMLLMVVSNAQLNYAVLIPKEDEEAVRILSVGSMLVFAFSLVILCAVLLFGTLLAAVLKSPGLAKWLLLLPATVFFSGVNVQLSAWFNRLARFKIITSSRVWTSVTTIVFSLGLSFLLEGAVDLL